MTTKNVHIWYEAKGTILAVGHVPQAALQHIRQVAPILRKGQQVLQVEVQEDALSTLHATHRVDPKKKVLVPLR